MSHQQDLPSEIYGVIADILVSAGLPRTCASLNEVSRTAYDGTVSVLWHTLDLSSAFERRLQPSMAYRGDGSLSLEWLENTGANGFGANWIR